MFLAFFGLFELGSALCGAATSSNMLIVGRAISGLGAAGIVNGSYTIIATVLPLAKQPCMDPEPLEEARPAAEVNVICSLSWNIDGPRLFRSTRWSSNRRRSDSTCQLAMV
jgi:hypothetical protein